MEQQQSSVKYQPKFGRVLIKREVKDKSAGGVILIDESKKRLASCEGIILALGETAGWAETFDPATGERVPIQTLEVGQKVLFGRHAGTWIDQTASDKDDGTLFMCADGDILAVIKEQ